MSLRRGKLDDAARADLDAIDAGLRGDPVDGQRADLATLVADVRQAAPQPTPAFLAELDARVREGFPPRDDPPAATTSRARRPRRRLLLGAGAGAVAASAVFAVTVIGVVGDDGREAVLPARSEPSSAVAESQTQAAPEQRQAAEAMSADGVAGSVGSVPVSPPADAALGRERRSVELRAALDLTVPGDEVQSTADGVIRATDRVGGIVQTSSISVGKDRTGEARFELRVPSQRLDDALAAYSKLGSVASRTQDAQDITGAVVSVEDRLSDARAERRALLRALGRADTRQEVASVRARLALTRAEIARLQGQLRAVRSRADLATVALTVRGDDDASSAGAQEEGGWSLGDAIRDAGRLLEIAAGAVIVGAAVLLPLLALMLAAGAGARALSRRRREQGLDAA